jgi:hypothetical protein
VGFETLIQSAAKSLFSSEENIQTWHENCPLNLKTG